MLKMPQEELLVEYADSSQTATASKEAMLGPTLSFLDSAIKFVTQEFTFSSKQGAASGEVTIPSFPPIFALRPNLDMSSSNFKVFHYWTVPKDISHPALATLRYPQWIFPKMQDFHPTWTTVQMPQQLAEIADDSALNLLSSDTKLIPYATSVCQLALRTFSNLGLSAKCSLTSYSDPESEDAQILLMEVRIRDKSYSEILSIWDKLSVILLSDLPADIQKRLSVVVDEA